MNHIFTIVAGIAIIFVGMVLIATPILSLNVTLPRLGAWLRDQLRVDPLVPMPLVPWTPQQVFDNALRGIRGQGYQRCQQGASCKYRGGILQACAAGWSIPDQLYSNAMEDHAVHELLKQYPELAKLFADVPQQLMLQLQNCHDGRLVLGKGAFEQRMQQIAENFQLRYQMT